MNCNTMLYELHRKTFKFFRLSDFLAKCHEKKLHRSPFIDLMFAPKKTIVLFDCYHPVHAQSRRQKEEKTALNCIYTRCLANKPRDKN